MMVPLVSVSSISNSIVASVKKIRLLGRYSAGDRATPCRAPAAGTGANFDSVHPRDNAGPPRVFLAPSGAGSANRAVGYSKIAQEPFLHPREDLPRVAGLHG